MKNSIPILFIITLIFTQFSFSQNATIIKGDKYYNFYSYSESIEKFEQITDKTTEIKRKLAESYYHTGNYTKSEDYYSQLMTTEDKTPEDIYKYAYVLAINGKYSGSEIWMKKYAELVKNDSRAEMYTENPNFYSLLMKDKGQFTIKNLDINTKQEDFGTSYYNGKIVYASTRELIKPIKRIWNWNNLPFLDMYIAETDSSMQFKNVVNFRGKVNKKYHEGTATFSKDGNFMVFTRDNYGKKSSDNIIKLQMFSAEFKNGKWTEPIAMPFNNKEYSVGHPTLSGDGKTMIFASDMPGGYGGVDLYVTYRGDDGTWAAPKNLGKTVNTEGNEMFPFLHPDHILFFSSDGLPGLGGLDVFYSNAADLNNLSKPENLGIPVNSNTDDFAFILDDAQKSGYFSSNRATGKGDDDIYAFKLLKPFVFEKIIKGTAYDKKGNILSNVLVNLYDNVGNVAGTITTTETGKYEFHITNYVKYHLDGTKLQYSKGENTADATGDELVIISDLILEKTPAFSLYCVITDYETHQIIDSVKVLFTDNIKSKSETIITPGTGDFFRNLKDSKLNDSICYTLKMEKRGYLTEVATYSKKLDHEGQYNISEDLKISMKKITIGTDLGKMFGIKPIYFDLSKWNIRPDAALELDKIVTVMNENPDLVIELGSHTDCRGSYASNEKLSDRRAKASAEYIKARISKPERIYGKGYGESQLINKCACEGSTVVPCTEAEHQQNRRTEFKIISN
jgi:outer membrane protein OmpA-like peptidoglycan-associated protein/tetratricopeptide (TPR) repeat protein